MYTYKETFISFRMSNSINYVYENYVIFQGNDYRHIRLITELQNNNLVKEDERDNSLNLLEVLLALRSSQR
jgi:hypothetical protein